MVPVGGLEPPRPKTTDFEKNMSIKLFIIQQTKTNIKTFAKTLQITSFVFEWFNE